MTMGARRQLAWVIALTLAMGAFGASSVASSLARQQPIETRTLLEERLELVPQGPSCWDVRSGSLSAGNASPATGYHVHGMVVTYVVDGVELIEWEEGTVVTLGPGQAAQIGENEPHRHESIGAGPRVNINFEMTCQTQPNSLGNTGPLPGIGLEPGTYQIQARERSWQPGAQTPVHVLTGPTATYVLEGTIGRSTILEVACSGAGDLYVSPVGERAQNTNIGEVPARTLDVDVWPTGTLRSVPQPAAQLPIADATEACPEAD